jgi:hypothetical protein
LFGVLKRQMKDREFESQQEILQATAKSWDDLTFAEVQSILWQWIEHLTWVAGNDGQYYPNSKTQFKKWSNS